MNIQSPNDNKVGQEGQKSPNNKGNSHKFWGTILPLQLETFLGSPKVLFVSSIFLLLQALQSCLNYPARVNYGPETEKLKEILKVQEAIKEESIAYDRENTFIDAQFVMELSHPQLAVLDEEDSYINLRRYPVQVYRITYHSSNFTPLSALVLLPVGTDITDYPVLSYHHGALLPFPRKNGGAYEAPSFFGSRYRNEKKFFAVTNYGLPTASSGYLTVMPDYMGYGVQAGAEHPFMIGPELGQESMDALRAVYQWAKIKGLQLRKELYLMGLSEGAYAGIWAQRLIEQAPDFVDIQLQGAYYAGPYNISSLLEKTAFGNPTVDKLFNWALYAIWDYFLRDSNTANKNLKRYFESNPNLQQLIDNPRSWKKTEIWLHRVPNILSILLQKPTPREKLFQPDFLQQLNDTNSEFWVLARLLNIYEGWQPKGPIYLYHNTEDPLIPVSNSQDAQANLNAAGAQVSLKTFERANHVGAYKEYFMDSLEQFSESSLIPVN